MSADSRSAMRSTVFATTFVGVLCGLAAVGMTAVWWWLGPNTVSCYWASYDRDSDEMFGEMAWKMWPTRWLWAGLLLAPTAAGALLGVLAARFGVRIDRRAG
ncbi:hypothetical protein [Nocardia carnea]|uniref:hypothetical protein n=1 Tax=Nocardia carnea TaxID=37328 RepID=UPI002456E658|nr:hypothetical protein [Nocardia carnea]